MKKFGIVFVVLSIEVVIVLAVLIHFGTNETARYLSLYKFAPLLGALVGSSLTMFSACNSTTDDSRVEGWFDKEQLAWILIGLGLFMWGAGDSFYRYYSAIGYTTFPSFADVGYIAFPLLCFIGLLLQPSCGGRLQRMLVTVDSLIAMGAILAISWYFVLGSVAQSPAETVFKKMLGLYYPTVDVFLLSCIFFLLMRGHGKLYQSTARKVGLFMLGLGLCFFVASDLNFNVQQSDGTYVAGTLLDLGWPLGLITIGLGAYLRRFLPATHIESKGAHGQRDAAAGFSSARTFPFLLILILILVLFVVLIINGVSTDIEQQQNRLVLLLATMGVVCLVLIRQILTMRENERLAHLQTNYLRQIEVQARQMNEYNKSLEEGISHLKAVQTSLVNGNLRARAHLRSGVLWGLASSLKLLAERLASLGVAKRQLDLLRSGLMDLGQALERYQIGQPFKLPESCENVPEVTAIVHSLGVQKNTRIIPGQGQLERSSLPETGKITKVPPMQRRVISPPEAGKDIKPAPFSEYQPFWEG